MDEHFVSSRASPKNKNLSDCHICLDHSTSKQPTRSHKPLENSEMSAALDTHKSECSVPPSAHPPTDTIVVNNFVRPLTLPAVKALLSAHGVVREFWMDSIKTHCYVTVRATF
jgi:hypothetical protein